MTDVYKRVGAMLLLQWMNRPERQPLTQGLETSFATDAAFEALREQVDQQSNGRLRLFRLKDSETALFFPERPAGTSGVVLRDDGDTEAYLPQFQQQGKMFILPDRRAVQRIRPELRFRHHAGRRRLRRRVVGRTGARRPMGRQKSRPR